MLHVQSLERRECCLKISEGSEVFLGRSKETGIQDSTISSKHVLLSAERNHEGLVVLRLTAKDAVRIQLPGETKIAKLLPGSSLQVRPTTSWRQRALIKSDHKSSESS